MAYTSSASFLGTFPHWGRQSIQKLFAFNKMNDAHILHQLKPSPVGEGGFCEAKDG